MGKTDPTRRLPPDARIVGPTMTDRSRHRAQDGLRIGCALSGRPEACYAAHRSAHIPARNVGAVSNYRRRTEQFVIEALHIPHQTRDLVACEHGRTADTG